MPTQISFTISHNGDNTNQLDVLSQNLNIEYSGDPSYRSQFTVTSNNSEAQGSIIQNRLASNSPYRLMRLKVKTIGEGFGLQTHLHNRGISLMLNSPRQRCSILELPIHRYRKLLRLSHVVYSNAVFDSTRTEVAIFQKGFVSRMQNQRRLA